ncbi:Aminoglycoside phosphotransferase [Metarhizium rileyi]|uniref:Aminoglycoside phosphotransferase n=1 Tax=Metarhizium rileyi (strain RCEF 4871) TaxID=1649241 RepID=A0A166W9Z4_METRR|nr:Aminoglycoside phosphotransferase [Metarhizium rileyi RCEF 4871]
MTKTGGRSERWPHNQDRDWGPPVFTHGDLNRFNILVRGDQVVGIIDWEFEGTSAWIGNKTRKAWQDIATQVPRTRNWGYGIYTAEMVGVIPAGNESVSKILLTAFYLPSHSLQLELRRRDIGAFTTASSLSTPSSVYRVGFGCDKAPTST